MCTTRRPHARPISEDNAVHKVRVHVYTVCWNEEQFLPFFLAHYAAFAERIVVYDNYSTDASPEIVRSCPKAELRQFDTGETFDEQALTQLRNTSYKESVGDADYVIVVDADELLHHPDLSALLETYKRDGVTLPKTVGYDMISWRFPRSSKPLTQSVSLGRRSPDYSKRCIFDPSIDINFRHGSHACKPVGNIVENQDADLQLRHYHYIGLLQCIRKHRRCGARLSRYNREHKLSYQYTWGAVRLSGRFLTYRLNAHDIVRDRTSVLTVLAGPPLNFIKGLYWNNERRKRWQ